MVSIAKVNHSPQSQEIAPLFAVALHGSQSGNIACATYHSVFAGNKLSVGRVMSAAKLKSVFEGINLQGGCKAKTPALIQEAVLFDDGDRVIWYRKRFVNSIWFRVGEDGAKQYKVEWPALLYCVNKNHQSMKIFALPSNSRPSTSTRLYHAPLMNINGNGVLCQGTAGIPRSIDVDCLDGCEESLIDSQFTHINHDHTLRKGASNDELVRYWRKKENDGRPLRVKAGELLCWGKMSELLNEGKSRHE